MGQGGEGGCFVVIATLLEATAADLLVTGRSNAYLAQTGVGERAEPSGWASLL